MKLFTPEFWNTPQSGGNKTRLCFDVFYLKCKTVIVLYVCIYIHTPEDGSILSEHTKFEYF